MMRGGVPHFGGDLTEFRRISEQANKYAVECQVRASQAMGPGRWTANISETKIGCRHYYCDDDDNADRICNAIDAIVDERDLALASGARAPLFRAMQFGKSDCYCTLFCVMVSDWPKGQRNPLQDIFSPHLVTAFVFQIDLRKKYAIDEALDCFEKPFPNGIDIGLEWQADLSLMATEAKKILKAADRAYQAKKSK